MARRSAQSAVFIACEEIVSGANDPDGRYSPAGEARWLRLWSTHVEEDLAATSIDDVALLCLLGWDLAVRDGDWVAATYRASRCTLHPDWPGHHGVSRQLLRGYIACGRLQLGQLEAALVEFRDLLDLQGPRDTGPLVIVRGHLYAYSRDRAPDEVVPTNLASLAKDVLIRFQGCVRLAKALRPENCTFGELTAKLRRSYST